MKEIAERKLLSTLLNKPELIKDIEFNPNWFAHPAYKEVAQAFAECQGEIDQYYDILKIIAEHNPYSPVDIELLASMRMETITTAHVEKEARTLKEAFLNNQIITAAANLTNMPNRENLTMLEYLMDVKAQDDEVEATGEIKPLTDVLRERFDKDMPEGLKTYGRLDLAFNGGLRGSKLITLAARPAVGKSAFAVNFAMKVLERNKNVRVDFFSLEMGDTQLYCRLLASQFRQADQCRLTMGELVNGRFGKDKWPLIKQMSDMLSSRGIWIDDSGFVGPDQIWARCKSLKSRNGLDLVIVDYLQLAAEAAPGKSLYEKTTYTSRYLKRIAKDLGVPLLALSQLTRTKEHTGDEYREPTLTDLRESGAIEQDADDVLFLWKFKEESGQPVDGIRKGKIAKQRNGPLGDFDLGFDAGQTKFYSIQQGLCEA